MEYQARWVALLAIVIVVGAFGALLIDRRTRVWTAATVGIVGILGLLMLSYMPVQRTSMSQTIQSSSGQYMHAESSVPLPPGYRSDQSAHSEFSPRLLPAQNDGKPRSWISPWDNLRGGTGVAAAAESPGIGFLPLLLIGGTVGLLIALAFRGRLYIHGHLAGLGGLAIGAVVVGALLTLIWMKTSALREANRHREVAMESQIQSEAPTRIREAETRELSAAPDKQYQGVIPTHAEAEENPKTAKTEPTQPQIWRVWHFANGTAGNETRNNKPDWIDDEPRREGDNYIVVVQSGTFPSDPILREQKLADKIVAVVRPYIDGYVLHQSGATDALEIDSRFLDKYVSDRCYYPSGEQAVRLTLGNSFVAEIEHQYKQFLSVDRVEKVAGIGLAGFLLLGGLYTYLRMTPASKHSPPLAAAAGQSVAAATPAEPNSTPTSKIGEAASQWRGYFSYWTFWILIGLLVLGVLAALGLMR